MKKYIFKGGLSCEHHDINLLKCSEEIGIVVPRRVFRTCGTSMMKRFVKILNSF